MSDRGEDRNIFLASLTETATTRKKERTKKDNLYREVFPGVKFQRSQPRRIRDSVSRTELFLLLLFVGLKAIDAVAIIVWLSLNYSSDS